jgi:hypothetical protein
MTTCIIIIVAKVDIGIVPINARGINIQLSIVSHAKEDNIALHPNHLLSCGCFNFIFWNILSFTKSQTT